MTPAAFIDDPNWAGFIPESLDAPRQRHLPTHEDCSRIDVDEAAAHLLRGGTLGRMPAYEERPGQVDMLRAIVRAFNGREHLMIEAGTGVGKSLAYLVPSILWAWTNDTPVVISTATRNLQSQLIHSDIPKARAVLGENASRFRVALLKGRGNYLCLRAVEEFFSAGYWSMDAEVKPLVPDFIDFLRSTPDGDLDAYEGLPRALLTCPGEECSGRRCPYYSRCFVYKARKAAAEAHLVIANHALVLAEATSPGGGILPAYARLVLDEAHNLEDIATDYLSCEFSLPALRRVLNRLSRRSRGRRGTTSGVLAQVERQMQKGILAGTAVGELVHRLVHSVPGRVTKAVNAADDLAEVAALLLRPARERGLCRYRVDANGRCHALHHLFEPYADWDENRLLLAQSAFESALAGLVNILHELRDALEAGQEELGGGSLGDLSLQLGGLAEALVAFANETAFVLRGDTLTHAYWAERVRSDRQPAYVRLVAAPLTVADDLKRLFYDVKDSVILSSATLRVGNDFRYMIRRLGCRERFQTLTASSPFDYFRQSLVLAPDCLPDPAANPSGYAERLASLFRDLFAVTHGRALVLFTSYEMMNAVAKGVRETLAAADIRLIVQGEGLSRESMTKALRQTPANEAGTVLFGAQSFWEGVDVAGEALSCVVLTRLPFAQVGDPVVEARGEQIERENGSSFRDYLLPEAVIKFRQGFGRLIRTRSDRGVVVITDPRIVTKNYGAIFKKSIPSSVHTVSDPNELLERVSSFFSSFDSL